MRTSSWWILIIVLFVVIAGLLLAFVFIPAPATPSAPTATSTTPTTVATSSLPLSASVSVSAPAPRSTVGQTFSVAGVAPNAWYFEAVFPIQVRDPNDNVIGRAQGEAQSDWTVEGLVPFNATMSIDGSYHGPATLILLKDNPSGLPQNDDSVEVPIVIQ